MRATVKKKPDRERGPTMEEARQRNRRNKERSQTKRVRPDKESSRTKKISQKERGRLRLSRQERKFVI